MVPDSMRDDCGGIIVRAHTVSKSGSLKLIAENGHVYAFVPSIVSIARGRGVLAPELRGVNRASTFSGFCAYHDKQLFSPVEDSPFEFTNEQCFLLAYRAQAREGFLKRAQRRSHGRTFNSDRHDAEPDRIQGIAAVMSRGIAAGVNDVERHKVAFDAVLASGDYSGVRSYVMVFDCLPTVMCSGGLFPYECFDGSIAQNLLDLETPAQAIYYNSFSAGEVGGVVFTWLSDSDRACSHFISTLEAVTDSDLTDTLIRFFFEYCENVNFSPTWWATLDRAVSKALVKRLNYAASPFRLRSRMCLAPDGMKYDDWSPQARYRLGPVDR